MTEPVAHLGGCNATELVEVSHDPAVLDGHGRWAVVIPYAGEAVFARFARWRREPPGELAGEWQGPAHWSSSMGKREYVSAVGRIRDSIAAGTVYQANLCRILEAELPDPSASDIAGLHALLARFHPAPFSGMIRIPERDLFIASASPELFLRRQGEMLESSPIKGTASHEEAMLDKDRAENVMIVDLVRNDLSRVCDNVEVSALMAVQSHPGLVHLVSSVRGRLTPEATWESILAATFPPGSVTGAPKYSALKVIDELEPTSRGPYCGAIGWVDADTGEAELAVAIRTFWLVRQRDRTVVRFGTGAGITWGSDPQMEWEETELKGARLTEIAAQTWPGSEPDAEVDAPGAPVSMTGITG